MGDVLEVGRFYGGCSGSGEVLWGMFWKWGGSMGDFSSVYTGCSCFILCCMLEPKEFPHCGIIKLP